MLSSTLVSLNSSLTSPCTPGNPCYFPKINLGDITWEVMTMLISASLTVCIYYLFLVKYMESNMQVHLYRDDGLACLLKIRGPNSDKIQKDIIRIFGDNFNLKIIITAMLKLTSWMLHSIYAPEDTNPIRNRKTHLHISMSTQIISLISSRHCQIAFQNK